MSDNHPLDIGIDGLEQAREVGVGGFATVYRAYQPAFRRTVAVKVLAAPNLDQASRERFERECQAMGALADHPHIVTIYGSGYTRQGRPYLVMAFLPGGSLQDRLDVKGPVPWQEATLHAVHLAGALETAHRAGIIHRDIKPGNVLLSGYGEAQLTDFGIARISGGHETHSGQITASMAHAPPEVLDGQRPSVAADVYSLGSMTYELLYGRCAFAAPDEESMVPMLRRILTEPPPDLRGHGVPEPVWRAIERAMAKSPDVRPASAAELGRELQAARRSLGADPGRLTVPAAGTPEGAAAVSFVSVAPPSPRPAAAPRPRAAPGAAAPAPPATPAAQAPAVPAPTPVPARTSGPRMSAARPRMRDLPPPPDPRPPAPRFGSMPPPSNPLANQRVVAAGVAAVLVAGALLAVTMFVRSRDDVPTPPASTEVNDGYTLEDEQQFADACVHDANTPQFCACLFDSIRAQFPYDEYVELNRAVEHGTPLHDTDVWPLAERCSKEFPSTYH